MGVAVHVPPPVPCRRTPLPPRRLRPARGGSTYSALESPARCALSSPPAYLSLYVAAMSKCFQPNQRADSDTRATPPPTPSPHPRRPSLVGIAVPAAGSCRLARRTLAPLPGARVGQVGRREPERDAGMRLRWRGGVRRQRVGKGFFGQAVAPALLCTFGTCLCTRARSCDNQRR